MKRISKKVREEAALMCSILASNDGIWSDVDDKGTIHVGCDFGYRNGRMVVVAFGPPGPRIIRVKESL